MSEHCQWLHEQLQARPVVRFPFDEAGLPENGIYFFYEDGEMWGHSGRQPRIVRIGTHRDGNFRSRIADHYLSRGRSMDLHVNKPAPKDRSIFRKHLGRALLAKAQDPYLEIWNIDFTTNRNRRAYGNRRNVAEEREIEEQVTHLLCEKFTFRYLELDVAVARMGNKGLEAALIGTVAGCTLCKPSVSWLGRCSPKPQIRQSGLWLVQHLKSRPINGEDKEAIITVLTRPQGVGGRDSAASDPTTMFPSRIANCPECDSDKIVFPLQPGERGKDVSSGDDWRCSECSCAGSQSGCTVIVTRVGKRRLS